MSRSRTLPMRPLSCFSLLAALALSACGDPNAVSGNRGMGEDPAMLGPDGQPVVNPMGTGPDGIIDPDNPVTGPEGTDPEDGVTVDDGDTDLIGEDPTMGETTPEAPGTVVEVPDLPEDADPVTSTDVFLGSRVRRLTNVEYGNTIADLFGIEVDISRLPADGRQNDFTRNISQAVDPVLGGHLQTFAEEVAASAVASGLEALAPCAASAADSACAQTLIEQFGERVYRRPLASSEVESLLGLYTAGAEGQANEFAAGVEVVLQAMLQSASFLYVSEMGQTAEGGEIVPLGPWELAASLSYLLTAHPPDADLIAAARDGSISEASVREAQATRLLGTPEAEQQIQRFVKEWLKLDRVAKLDKADDSFDALRAPMEAETDAFISAIAVNGDGRLSTMLTAGYTFVGPEMASFYGVQADGEGRAELAGTGRLGLLQQASFLAANSQNDESGPVLRGVAVLRKLLCVDLPDPSESDDPEVQMVMPPARDEQLTTRQRFEDHAVNPKCVTCHSMIDPIGFSFENFDAIGRVRTEDPVGSSMAVDTSGGLNVGTAVDGAVADSVELSLKLAQTPKTSECFARHIYRYGSASSEAQAEGTFVRSLGEAATISDNVKTLLIQLVESNSFLLRRTPTAAEQL